MNKLNLNVPINSLGYGVVGYNVWLNIRNLCNVTLWPIADKVEPPVKIDQSIIDDFNIDIRKQEDYDCSIPTLKIWHENRLAEHIGRGQYFVLPFFEVNKFNKTRISHLKSATEIIVASDWAKQVIEDNDIRNTVHVVPCGVDRFYFNEKIGNNTNTEKCVFLNCGKWEVRKGHDVLHRAFKDAFSNNEDVELWMMTQNPFLQPHEKQLWENLYSPDIDSRFKLLPRVQYQNELINIMSHSFCGVFPARAEGWNLEILEMMSMGKHIITTNYSAHTQFCNQDNCNLINIDKEEKMYDGKWFVGENGTWASLEGTAYDQLVEHLRTIYKKWILSPYKLNHMGIETSKKLSWEKMTNKINKIIFGGNK